MVAGIPRCNPELWFRPCSGISLQDLYALFANGSVVATIRLGARNDLHEKGYVPGEVALVRLLDAAGTEYLQRSVRIEAIGIKQLQQVSRADLRGTCLFASIEEVQRELAIFEKRPVRRNELVSIIRFSYL